LPSPQDSNSPKDGSAKLSAKLSSSPHRDSSPSRHQRSESAASSVLPLEIVPAVARKDMTFVPSMSVGRCFITKCMLYCVCLPLLRDSPNTACPSFGVDRHPQPLVCMVKRSCDLMHRSDCTYRVATEPVSDLLFIREALYTACHGASVRCWQRVRASPQPAEAKSEQPPPEAGAPTLPSEPRQLHDGPASGAS
jgi:hypothetical protein